MLEVSPAEDFCQSEAGLRQIIESMPAWIQVCTLDGAIEMVNEAGTLISGYKRAEMVCQVWPYP
jgi:PAS domain S-box-containing protein